MLVAHPVDDRGRVDVVCAVQRDDVGAPRAQLVEALSAAMAATSLRLAGQHAMGPDYARTLRLWRERFESADVETLGFDEVFRRMWRFYLAYSEAGFRSGYLNVRQLLLERSP